MILSHDKFLIMYFIFLSVIEFSYTNNSKK